MRLYCALLFLLCTTSFAASLSYTLSASATTPLQWTFTTGASGNNPTLLVSVGDVLTFRVNTLSGSHPFSIHTSSSIATSARYTGFTEYTGDGTGTGVPTLTIGANMVGLTLYYVCERHPTMVGQIKVAGTPPGLSTAASPFPPLPILDYCSRLAKTTPQTQFMGSVIDRFLTNSFQDDVLVKYYDGTKPAGSKNYVTSATNKAQLHSKYVSFFGDVIGCTHSSFPKKTSSDLAAIHAGMGIDRETFDLFVKEFDDALNTYGATGDERSGATAILNSYALQIVNPKLICAKYASAAGLSQVEWLKKVVSFVLNAEKTDGMLSKYFDGSMPGSTSYTTDAAKFDALVNSYASFFASMFGCTGVPAAGNGRSLADNHASLPIGRPEMNRFIDIVVGAMDSVGGLSNADLQTVLLVLQNYIPSLVKPSLLCPKYAAAQGLTNHAFMTKAVTAAINNEFSDADLVKLFNGVAPPGSTNYVSNSANFDHLVEGFVRYLGGMFGCGADPAFPAFTGKTDMAALHAGMPIDLSRLANFNVRFVQALESTGVSAGDRETVKNALDSAGSPIPNPSYICSKYATALGVSQLDLIMTLVSEIFKHNQNDPRVVVYFNGTHPRGATNFVSDLDARQSFFEGTGYYFGAGVGCTDPKFPQYTGSMDMKAVHAHLGITKVDFDAYVANILDTLIALGITREDRQRFADVLNSFAFIINPGGDVPLDDEPSSVHFSAPSLVLFAVYFFYLCLSWN